MKNFTLKLFLLFFITFQAYYSNAQYVTESVSSYKDSYTKLFNVDGVIKMDLVKEFELGTTDTSYSFIIRISNFKTDIDIINYLGTHTDSYLDNLGYTVNTHSTREIFALSPIQLKALYNCANEILRYNESLKINNFDKSSITKCKSAEVQLKGEYAPRGYVKTIYYLEVGENVYEMKKKDFRNIMLNVQETLHYLQTKGEIISVRG